MDGSRAAGDGQDGRAGGSTGEGERGASSPVDGNEAVAAQPDDGQAAQGRPEQGPGASQPVDGGETARHSEPATDTARGAARAAHAPTDTPAAFGRQATTAVTTARHAAGHLAPFRRGEARALAALAAESAAPTPQAPSAKRVRCASPVFGTAYIRIIDAYVRLCITDT